LAFGRSPYFAGALVPQDVGEDFLRQPTGLGLGSNAITGCFELGNPLPADSVLLVYGSIGPPGILVEILAHVLSIRQVAAWTAALPSILDRVSSTNQQQDATNRRLYRQAMRRALKRKPFLRSDGRYLTREEADGRVQPREKS
jgi:hypothetical protein